MGVSLIGDSVADSYGSYSCDGETPKDVGPIQEPQLVNCVQIYITLNRDDPEAGTAKSVAIHCIKEQFTEK